MPVFSLQAHLTSSTTFTTSPKSLCLSHPHLHVTIPVPRLSMNKDIQTLVVVEVALKGLTLVQIIHLQPTCFQAPLHLLVTLSFFRKCLMLLLQGLVTSIKTPVAEKPETTLTHLTLSQSPRHTSTNTSNSLTRPLLQQLVPQPFL